MSVSDFATCWAVGREARRRRRCGGVGVRDGVRRARFVRISTCGMGVLCRVWAGAESRGDELLGRGDEYAEEARMEGGSRRTEIR